MTETKHEVIVTSRQTLLAVAESAVALVEDQMGHAQNARVALSLLRGFGVLGPGALESVPIPCQPIKADTDATENGVESATLAPPAVLEGEVQVGTIELEQDAVEQPDAVLDDLLPEQQTVIAALLAGKSLVKVAETAKIPESTLRTWLAEDLAFYSVLGEMQFDRNHNLLAMRVSFDY